MCARKNNSAANYIISRKILQLLDWKSASSKNKILAKFSTRYLIIILW